MTLKKYDSMVNVHYINYMKYFALHLSTFRMTLQLHYHSITALYQ